MYKPLWSSYISTKSLGLEIPGPGRREERPRTRLERLKLRKRPGIRSLPRVVREHETVALEAQDELSLEKVETDGNSETKIEPAYEMGKETQSERENHSTAITEGPDLHAKPKDPQGTRPPEAISSSPMPRPIYEPLPFPDPYLHLPMTSATQQKLAQFHTIPELDSLYQGTDMDHPTKYIPTHPRYQAPPSLLPRTFQFSLNAQELENIYLPLDLTEPQSPVTHSQHHIDSNSASPYVDEGIYTGDDPWSNPSAGLSSPEDYEEVKEEESPSLTPEQMSRALRRIGSSPAEPACEPNPSNETDTTSPYKPVDDIIMYFTEEERYGVPFSIWQKYPDRDVPPHLQESDKNPSTDTTTDRRSTDQT